MNACQSLQAALIVFATMTAPLSGIRAQTQDTTTPEEASFSSAVAPTQDTASVEEVDNEGTAEAEQPNPFVPATTPPADAAKVEAVSKDPAPSEQVPPAQPSTSGDIVQSPVVAGEEIVPPIPEAVVLPTTSPAVISVPSVQPEIFFDSPAPSQSDRRISKEKVTELRQQRALYRANQRMARMEYNLWMGREPLRPRWSPMPMMNSRYPTPTIVVPVFINPR